VRDPVLKAYAGTKVSDTELTSFLKFQNPALVPDLSPANRETALKNYLDFFAQNLDSIFFARFKEKYQAKILKPLDTIAEATVEKYYQDSLELFRQPPVLLASHIELNDFDQAEKILGKLKKGSGFSALVKSSSVNQATKSRDGRLDSIHPDQDLKEVEGPTATFYKRLAKIKTGEISDIFTVFLSGTQKHYHIFKILEVLPQAVRPLDAVRDTIRSILVSRITTPLSDAFVIAEIKGQPITVAAMNKLLLRFPEQRAQAYRTRDGSYRLLDYYLRFTLYGFEAQALGYSQQSECQRQRQEQQDKFLSEEYSSKFLQPNAGIDPREIRKYFEKYQGTILGPAGDTLKTLEAAQNVILKKILVTDQMIGDYYQIYQEDYEKEPGVAKPLAEVKTGIESKIYTHERDRLIQQKTEALVKKYGGKVYQAKYREAGSRLSAQEYMDLASRLHEDKDLFGSVKMLQEIRFTYPQSNLLSDICLTIAQIDIEQKKYQESINEYRRLLRLYPDSKNNYKAQFMIGFVYSENLKEKDKALAAYRQVISQYPTCDLADDAQFMINSLESGEEFNIPDLPEEPAAKPAS
jgi:TolA-binding protein